MTILSSLAGFFGGAFLVNAIPHLVSGLMGRAFQTPFAKPSGVGLSSSSTNFLWGFFNALLAGFLLARITFSPIALIAPILGAFLIGLFCSLRFGKFHGGNHPIQGGNAPRQ